MRLLSFNYLRIRYHHQSPIILKKRKLANDPLPSPPLALRPEPAERGQDVVAVDAFVQRLGDGRYVAGRWRVMEYLPRRNNWIEAFTWETRSKAYRHQWPTSAIIDRLGRSRV